MARQRISLYSFTPGVGGSGTIEVQGRFNLEDFLAIYNTTDQLSIYNFGDTTQGGTVAYSSSASAAFPNAYAGVTTLTLDADTSTMSASDKLAIYVENPAIETQPWAFGQDAIGRSRVSNPQSLIDADFEYGLQNTKWQNFSVNNNIPGFFEYTGADLVYSTNGYATLLAGDDVITSNVDTSVRLSNPGSPPWVANDFALLISQTQGNTAAFTTTFVSANIPSPQERTINVGNTTGFTANDNILFIPIPSVAASNVAVANITSNATTTVNVSNASGIVDGSYILVQTNTTNIYEAMAVTNVAANALTVIRQTNNTNSAAANITIGNNVYVVSALEIAKVASVANSTALQVQRGWYNIQSANTLPTGSIVQKLSGNVELVEHTAVTTTVNGVQTISRSAYGSTALTAAGAGSLFVRMTGLYNASTNASVPLVAVNAPSHSIDAAGQYVTSINTYSSNTEGINIVSTLGLNTNNFSFYPHRDPALALGFTLNQSDTIIREAFAFTGADLDVASITSDAANPSTLTVTTNYPHGLTPGSPILCNLSSGTNYTYGIGSFYIVSVPSTTTFTYTAKTGAAISGTIAGIINVRSNAVFSPRPFDGGVIMGPGVPTRGASASRQTKKYFRYQSGKGILFTSGTMLKPTFDITALSAAGTAIGSAITVSTDIENGLNAGAVISISGVNTSGYSLSNYIVTSITSDTSFTVEAQQLLGSTTPELAPQPRVNVTGWSGSSVRAGIFDDQNGLFWECDGQTVSIVQRSSTFQVAGYVSVGVGSNLITGDATARFQDQLNNGDVVVIRGMTHTVTSILDQQRMTVVPAYRGVSNQNRIKMCLRQEIRVHQADFNIDPLDGTGPSGYTLDSSKMQMLGVEYSWYGAGYAQWMIRGQDGDFIMVHKITNNNRNNEAYMRTGNLPGRYEAINETPVSSLNGAIDASQTTITLKNATDYPSASVAYPAFIMIDAEILKYTGKNGNQLTGCTRAATFTQWLEGATRSFTGPAASSHTDNTGVILISNTCAPVVNHWGSAVIMDGNFDSDQGYQFTFNRTNYGMPATVNTKQLAFAMRLAPSVSNGIVGDLGQRDLINRAQLTMAGMVINITAGRYLIEGILNPDNIDAANTAWSGLNNSAGGFQPSFTQFATSPLFTATSTGGLVGSASGQTGGMSKSGTSVTRSSPAVYTAITPTNVSSSGTGGILTVTLNAVLISAPYTNNNTAIVVTAPGSGYVVGDTIKVLGTSLGGATPANDLTLTLVAVAAQVTGGERLFAIPISTTNSGLLDLSSVKQIGTSAIPGTGVYPNGPEILAIQITALQTVASTAEIQLQFNESQA